MNKKGFIENWGAFFVLTIVGYIMSAIMFTIWGNMDYVVPLTQKIIMLLLIPLPAVYFTKMWFE